MLRTLSVACLALLCASCSSSGAASDVPSPTATTAPVTPTSAPSTTASACDDPPCYGEIESLGVIDPEVVSGVSGMAASHRTPGLFYAVSDHVGTSEVAVIEEDGTLVGRLEIDGMSARNVEDLAVGPCGTDDRSSCLFIADIGNHVGLEDLYIYRVPEPDLDDLPTRITADQLRFTYPGEPTDAEALIVDDAGRPLVISKATFDEPTGRTGPTQLLRGSTDGGVLEHLGDLDFPEPQSPMFALMVGHVVTGADSMDGRVIIRTYDEIYEFRAPGPGADLAEFPSWPFRVVPAPFQVQSETVAYRVDGCGYSTTSEPSGAVDAVTCLDNP